MEYISTVKTSVFRTVQSGLSQALLAVLFAALPLTSGAQATQDDPAGAPSASKKKDYGLSARISMYPVIHTATLRVIMEKYKGESVTIFLKNSTGNLLQKALVPKKYDRFSARFDFDDLPDGAYTLEISNGVETISKNILFSTRSIVEKPVYNRNLVATN